MRIVIKEPDALKPIRIIIPYHLMINLAVRKSWIRLAVRHGVKSKTGQEQKILSYLEDIDFGELRGALHDISAFKGLVLLEVQDADGTFVQITT